MTDLEATCPAASTIAGARTGGAAVVCGVMHRERRSMDSILFGGEIGVLLTVREDPSTVFALCCGDDVPMVEPSEDKPRAHYTNCPIWQDEIERIEEGRSAIFDLRELAARREMRELASKAGDLAMSVGPQDMNRLERAEWV